MDKSTFAGILVALGGIFLGLTLEGGKVAQIMQPTAAMIVFGGTLGAVMIQFPLPVVLEAFKRLSSVFFNKAKDPHERIAEIVALEQIDAHAGHVVPVPAGDAALLHPFRRRPVRRELFGRLRFLHKTNDPAGVVEPDNS